MRIFGYDNNDLEFAKIIELSQATLTCQKTDLDKMIEFLMEVKKEIDNSKTESGDHWHYRDYNNDWKEEEADLIIFIDESSND